MRSTIQPRNGYIHFRLHLDESNILLPDGAIKPKTGEACDAHGFMEVLAVAPDVTECKPGDFILLHIHANMMQFSTKPPTALVAKGSVMGVFNKEQATISTNN